MKKFDQIRQRSMATILQRKKTNNKVSKESTIKEALKQTKNK